ncbi:conserved hypothetical protein [Rhodopseudomonas palustris HaA2]|uniref:Uncharacterized protein n=1 Tax=Rhodopseudomonas palustris (strain HaA2) TaxID=316058 RepID=Q2ITL8_RHOP2|nr:hypothetical protein [Rhodopseudomonas palustris]ABD08442.1 conserved hypothetical protein [Rhodopseudomonas palustris HaA2]
MAHLIYKCPRTAMKVQTWIAEEVAHPDPTTTFEPVRCPACTHVHFINRSSGRLLGDRG